MNIRFDNKVVLVTGGSSGIGRATAMKFAESGARVAVNYNKSKVDAEAIVAEIKRSGGNAISVKADVTLEDEVRQMIMDVLDTYGEINILVNNAGGLLRRSAIDEMETDLLDQVIDLNLKSIFLVTREVVPLMKKQHSGHIINISSIAARNGGGPGAAHYSSAKGAVITFTKNLAKELAPLGIYVNAVAPGIIDTRFHEGITPRELRQKFTESIPLRREGRAEEIAWPILFLASEYASFMVGETLEVNGGQIME